MPDRGASAANLVDVADPIGDLDPAFGRHLLPDDRHREDGASGRAAWSGCSVLRAEKGAERLRDVGEDVVPVRRQLVFREQELRRHSFHLCQSLGRVHRRIRRDTEPHPALVPSFMSALTRAPLLKRGDLPALSFPMRLATWNVNSVVARLPRLVDWLASSSPDVLCLQETKIADDAFPRAEVEALGYEVALHGDGRWNGVAIISRVGLGDVARGFAGAPGFPGLEARAMSATCGGLRVWTLYVPNGRALDSDHYPYKLSWLAALRTALLAERATSPPLFICGDFNIAPGDDDVWDPAAFIGSNACQRARARGARRSHQRPRASMDVRPRAFKGPPVHVLGLPRR